MQGSGEGQIMVRWSGERQVNIISAELDIALLDVKLVIILNDLWKSFLFLLGWTGWLMKYITPLMRNCFISRGYFSILMRQLTQSSTMSCQPSTGKPSSPPSFTRTQGDAQTSGPVEEAEHRVQTLCQNEQWHWTVSLVKSFQISNKQNFRDHLGWTK